MEVLYVGFFVYYVSRQLLELRWVQDKLSFFLSFSNLYARTSVSRVCVYVCVCVCVRACLVCPCTWLLFHLPSWPSFRRPLYVFCGAGTTCY